MADKSRTAVSGPELKVVLSGLGLSPAWFAKRLGVTMRTVVRWFDAEVIPDRAATLLDELNELTLAEMRTVLQLSESGVVHTYRTDQDLTNGQMPASWHRALTFRVLEHLHAIGDSVTVTYHLT